MPTFNVQCADQETGRSEYVKLEARDELEAVQTLRRKGHDARSVSLIPDHEETPMSTSVMSYPAHAGKGSIICPNPNCKYQGPAKAKARGSRLGLLAGLVATAIAFLIMPLLGIAFLLICIIYFAMNLGYKRLCPRCGNAIPS